MIKQYVYILCLIVLLPACTPVTTSQPATVTPAMPLAAPAIPTSITASATTAPTASPMAPDLAAGTAALTAGTAAPSANITQTPAATIDTTATAVVQSLVANAQPLLLKAFSSPDGEWRAEVLAYPCTKVIPGEAQEFAYEVLRVAHLKDRQVFTAWTQLQYCGGLGAFGLGGIQWSPDSRFFYFTDAREGVPDGGGFYGWYRNVFRFDTNSTQPEYLGAGPFSPDGQMIALVRTQLQGGCHPGGLAVLDNSGPVLAEYPFDLPPEGCGFSYLAWAPDGDALAYTLAVCSSSGTDCRSALYLVELANGQAQRQVLLENEPMQFVNIAWDTAERLELWSIDTHWFYDLTTGQLERQP